MRARGGAAHAERDADLLDRERIDVVHLQEPASLWLEHPERVVQRAAHQIAVRIFQVPKLGVDVRRRK